MFLPGKKHFCWGKKYLELVCKRSDGQKHGCQADVVALFIARKKPFCSHFTGFVEKSLDLIWSWRNVDCSH